MSVVSRSTRTSSRAAAVVAAVVAVLWSSGAFPGASLGGPSPAAAEVVHGAGFAGTVAGWRSWYGSYGLAAAGAAWCIDHGLVAPDAAYGYAPTATPDVDADTSAAMAWILGRHASTDPVVAAATMLALHDLRGAVYPTGRLDVDRLSPSQLSGFGGYEDEVVATARHLKSDGLAHRGMRGPFLLRVTLPDGRPGATVSGTVRLTDARGAGVAGVVLRLRAEGATLASPATVTTAADGSARATVRLIEGTNRLRADGRVPDPTLAALASTTIAAQRVGVPRLLTVDASDTATAHTPTGTLVIRKTGDAAPFLPIDGAQFTVGRAGGGAPASASQTVTVRADGRTPSLQLTTGAYTVTETLAPPGYRAAGPWAVTVADGRTTTLEVTDRAIPGTIELGKVDAVSHAPVGGARIRIEADRDLSGRYATHLATVHTTMAATVLRDVLPGRYRAIETTAPPGYEADPTPVPFVVRAGQRSVVHVSDRPRSTVTFRKVPFGPTPSIIDFTGAVFTVRADDDAQTVVGSCTTGADGHCALASGALVGGGAYCWAETAAPAGWALATGGCFTASGAGETLEIEVEERSLETPYLATKSDAETGEPLEGATYALFAVDPDPEPDPELSGQTGIAPVPATLETARQHLPSGAAEGWREVARATSDPDGRIDFGRRLPDRDHCVIEVRAPAGYTLDTEPHCFARPDGRDPARAVAPLALTDTRIPPTTTAPPTTTPPTTTPPTTAPPTTTPPTAAPPISAPPISTPPATPGRPELPRTGTDAGALASVGGSLLLCGAALRSAARERRARLARRGARRAGRTPERR